jgi:DHA2 family multidrug resistance protein-like MFS transporter
MVMAWGVVEAALFVVGIGLVLQGMGHGLALPALTSSVASSVPEADLGIASAASRLMSQTGAAFGIVALTLVYAGNNTQGSFGQALLAGAALSALSLPAAFAMGRRSVGSRQLARTE